LIEINVTAAQRRYSIKTVEYQMSLLVTAATLVAANMCLQGGEQADVSRWVPRTANAVEIKVVMTAADVVLLVYSPGYEDQPARFTREKPFGSIPIAEPILCIKGLGGPFEFEMEVLGVDDASERPSFPSMP
jgi:hypothetical protein